MKMYGSFPLWLTFLAQLASAVDIDCEKGFSKTKVPVAKGLQSEFNAEYKILEQGTCVGIYKMSESCKEASVTCTDFVSASSDNKLIIKRQNAELESFTGGEEIPRLTFNGHFKLKVSKRKDSTFSLKCTVKCDFPGTNTTETTTDKGCRCGISGPSRIVGGHQTEYNEYPWQVMILKDSKFTCGGSVISDRWILSAAHCFHDQDPRRYLIMIGGHHNYWTKSRSELITPVLEIIIHDRYSQLTLRYDFALVKMDPIDFNRNSFDISPVCLPSLVDWRVYENGYAIVTGWGLTMEGGHASSVLMETRLMVISNHMCKNQLASSLHIYGEMLCAWAAGKDACQGDSGGPLVASSRENEAIDGESYELIGVVSWGIGCARPDYPGVYARVTSVLDWIKHITLQSRFCSKI